MKNTTIESSCLSYEQLRSYSLNESEKAERAQLYLHISTCELCACAVNGFTAISFTSAEVDAIHHQIDVKTNVSHAGPLTFAQVFIACASVISIFGFYQFAESFSRKKLPLKKTEYVVPVVNNFNRLAAAPLTEITPEAEPVVVSVPSMKVEPAEMIYAPVEEMSSITPDPIPVTLKHSDLIVEHINNSNVIYIYDLKVTDYNSLYFNYSWKPFEVVHTPASKENKDAADLLESDGQKVIAADKILKSGLYNFTKGKFEQAIAEFNLLLEYDPQDVNALFYSAVSYYQTGHYRHTIKNLEKVLKSGNNVFHPEAKWNLALSYLKAGEKSKAKQLFADISSERGFYSGRATEKLKGLSPL